MLNETPDRIAAEGRARVAAVCSWRKGTPPPGACCYRSQRRAVLSAIRAR